MLHTIEDDEIKTPFPGVNAGHFNFSKPHWRMLSYLMGVMVYKYYSEYMKRDERRKEKAKAVVAEQGKEGAEARPSKPAKKDQQRKEALG